MRINSFNQINLLKIIKMRNLNNLILKNKIIVNMIDNNRSNY